MPERHFVLGTPLEPPFPEGFEEAMFGMGCFWGAERKFWEADGVYTTAVGYAGGFTPEPDLRRGVQRAHRPHRGRARRLRPGEDLATRSCCSVFWESHDPTQGMRQGNDVGTQYRSAIYSTHRAQRDAAEASRDALPGAARRRRATARSRPRSSTRRTFYYAEDYHQQYLAKNPNGYCGIGGTGVSCPVGLTGA